MMNNSIHNKYAEIHIVEKLKKLSVALATICDGVIIIDTNFAIELLNPIAEQLTGWKNTEAGGLKLNQVFKLINNNQQAITLPVEKCFNNDEIVIKNDVILLHKKLIEQFIITISATPIKHKQQIIGVIIAFHNVTEIRKITQVLTYKAKHDALTGLYNRLEFQVQLQHIIQRLQTDNSTHVLLYMDLDRFKIVNDTCGHEAGDQLLRTVSSILQEQVDGQQFYKQATLARLGGDEFGLLLEDCTLEQAIDIANGLCRNIDNFRFFWENEQHKTTVFSVGISIGLVFISKKTFHNNIKSLIAMADTACYAAKNAGRNTVHIYKEHQVGESPYQKNVQWVSLLNEHLEQDEGFSLYYQPIIALEKAKSKEGCYEILLRMKDQNNLLVPPGAFLSIATRYNLMHSLDKWVVTTVLEWLATKAKSLKHLNLITINISGYSLHDDNFLQDIITYIKTAKIPANKICFEITENTVLNHFNNVLEFITAFKKQGCRFAVDNFGSGVASFSYIKNLPVDFLKIDGALIRNITNDAVSYAVVKSINEIAHIMGVQTIAEAIETQIILDKLKEIEVDYVQGYWVAKPKPLSTI
ncbi:MAG: EAL domain-containing protein [Thiomargarita sp.]|nr:EAL domain-containing protein [Thiomargarita sp.]